MFCVPLLLLNNTVLYDCTGFFLLLNLGNPNSLLPFLCSSKYLLIAVLKSFNSYCSEMQHFRQIS